jgi:hypothetical protein
MGGSPRRRLPPFRDPKRPERFEFGLARELKKTHAELMSGTSAKELVWWRALYALENEEREREARRRKTK